jgi:hypothetical protein
MIRDPRAGQINDLLVHPLRQINKKPSFFGRRLFIVSADFNPEISIPLPALLHMLSEAYPAVLQELLHILPFSWYMLRAHWLVN